MESAELLPILSGLRPDASQHIEATRVNPTALYLQAGHGLFHLWPHELQAIIGTQHDQDTKTPQLLADATSLRNLHVSEPEKQIKILDQDTEGKQTALLFQPRKASILSLCWHTYMSDVGPLTIPIGPEAFNGSRIIYWCPSLVVGLRQEQFLPALQVERVEKSAAGAGGVVVVKMKINK